jgi:hypothetical protein
MSTPTFELDRSPAAFIATLEVDSIDDAGTGTAVALVVSPPSARALAIWHHSRNAPGHPGSPCRYSGNGLP